MKVSKRFLDRCRKLALPVAILTGVACGPSFDPNEFMSFFIPESSNAKPDDQRYFFTPQFYNDTEIMEQYQDSTVVDENVQAWAAYSGGLSAGLVSKALYDEDAGAVNTLTSKLSHAHAPAVDYLKFAWTADNGQGDAWNPNPEPADSANVPALLEQAKTTYATTTDPFLKERYAFQAVKLATVAEDYQQAQQLYNKLVSSLPKKTFISDWALCRRAGATLALGDTAQAVYEFAQVFDRCPSRRKAAETSLRKYGIKFQEGALKYAKTDGERAAVFALCAIQPGQDALDMLKEIVRLTPKNPLVELVMAREINRNEYYFFTSADEYTNLSMSDQPDSAGFVKRKEETSSYFDKLRSFALESAENKDLGDGAFWYTAAAYLDYLGKDYKAAQAHLDQAALLSTPNKTLKTQIAVQRMLLLAAQTEQISPEVENQLIGYLEEFDSTGNFRISNAYVDVCKRFAGLYEHKTEPKTGWLSSCSRSKAEPVDGPSQAKAYLLTVLTTLPGNPDSYFASTTDQNQIEDSVRAATVQQVIAYADQPNPGDFDKRLVKLSRLTNETLNLLLGRRLMMEHHYMEAANAFSKVDPKTWDTEAFTMYFQTNPFAVKMPQLTAVNFPAESQDNPFTPVTFARRMAELEQQAKSATGDKAAELYYQLGCGAWNLSWYGNSWLLAKSYWSGVEPILYDIPFYGTPSDPVAKQKRFEVLQQTDYYTTAHAQQYFEQSAKAAKTPAIADRSAYMVARCEENTFVIRRSIEQVRHGYVYDQDSTFVKDMLTLRKTKYASAFNDYLKNHTHSKFHQEMLRECPLYKDFLVMEDRIGE